MDSNLMWEDRNYLEGLRREISPDRLDECQAANFSDFTLDGKEPPEAQKDFLMAMQGTAGDLYEKKTYTNKSANSQLCVMTAVDLMSTWLFVFPPANKGKEITEELIMDVLDECGIVYGINREIINYVVRAKLYLKLFCVAEGNHPVDGVEGRIVDHYPRIQMVQGFDIETIFDVTKAYRKPEGLYSVSMGAVICDIQLPSGSIDGMTVTGRILEGKTVMPINLPVGENIGLNEDKSALVSKINGTLIYDKDKFVVKDIMILFSGVDASIGNIDVVGSLEIHGDVQSGISLRATKNIVIYGMVGNCTIVAGGDITIEMGVRGSSRAILKSGGSIHSKYMENCFASAEGSVVSEGIINCEIHSDDYVDADRIVGGSIYALHKVNAKLVGIKQRRETIIYLGLTQDTLNEKGILEERIRELKESLKDMVKIIRSLKSQSRKDVKAEEKRYQLENKKIAQEEELAEYKERLKQLDAVISDTTGCELLANQMFPPVKVMMRSDSLLINREQNMCRVWAVDGEIHIV